MNAFFVYLLVSKNGKLTGGITNDLDAKLRMAERINGRVAVDGYLPAYLLYYERFKNYRPAVEFLERCREWIRFNQNHKLTLQDLQIDFLKHCVLKDSKKWITVEEITGTLNR